MSLFIESIRVEHGEVPHIDFHQARIQRTWQSCGLAHEPLQLEKLLPAALPDERHKWRLVYSEEGLVSQTLEPYVFRLIDSLKIVYCDNIDYACKFADRSILERLYAQRGAAQDILIVKNGLLTDTSIANIALSNGDIWYTPRTPLLKGTKREELLYYGFLEEADLTVEDLRRFAYIRLLNAMVDFEEWSFPTSNILFR
ncbi:MAG: aminotransferase class IV [Phocaeicola sp.]|nr:aminotransferase class IV [Phocaeicola sp.]MDD7447629.1 aminotransferase class IV [Prevotellaceae bacterium]MDY3913550.1 aminotransferase class IV [Phocaeicola sp.]MDY5938307.1 aminotransferase class IV [Phocaeicola sp.]